VVEYPIRYLQSSYSFICFSWTLVGTNKEKDMKLATFFLEGTAHGEDRMDDLKR
jgi:hypothetical protein